MDEDDDFTADEIPSNSICSVIVNTKEIINKTYKNQWENWTSGRSSCTNLNFMDEDDDFTADEIPSNSICSVIVNTKEIINKTNKNQWENSTSGRCSCTNLNFMDEDDDFTGEMKTTLPH